MFAEDDIQAGLAFEARVETQAVLRQVEEQARQALQSFVGSPRIAGVSVDEDTATVEAEIVMDVPMTYIRLLLEIGDEHVESV